MFIFISTTVVDQLICKKKEIVFEYGEEEGKKETRVVKGDLIVGADGAFSEVRNAILRKRGTDYSQEYLSHSYKELTIPAKDGEYALEKNVLHIWPRGDFMMIALPNPDKSFTVTLFLPNEKFDKLTTKEEVTKFFNETFPDSVPIMPTYLDDFFKNPTGSLITIKVSPWHFGDSAVILGDAAHAIVPFYGQGMNASLEDVTFLDSLIEQHNGNFEIILSEFSKLRKPNADAIAELSQRNYIEMRSKVSSKLFLWRTALEKKIYKYFPNRWMPLYSMVTFSNIPYSEVIKRADRQNKILDRVFNLIFRGGAVASLSLLCYLGYKNRNQLAKL